MLPPWIQMLTNWTTAILICCFMSTFTNTECGHRVKENKNMSAIVKLLNRYNPKEDGKCGSKPNIYHNCQSLSFIYGGVDASPNAWPWMTFIAEYRNGRFSLLCGGSLLDANTIISAAHCFYSRSKLENLRIVLGAYDIKNLDEAEVFRIESAFTHPDYDPLTTDNDIAIIKFRGNAEFSDKISPICLPASPIESVLGATCFSTGWGSTEDGHSVSQYLKEVCLPIIPWDKCRDLFGKELTENMICSGDIKHGEIDTCDGDSGGPLVCYNKNIGMWELHGIVSWGYGCGRPKNPGISTYVYRYKDWIAKNI